MQFLSEFSLLCCSFPYRALCIRAVQVKRRLPFDPKSLIDTSEQGSTTPGCAIVNSAFLYNAMPEGNTCVYIE